jgi:hypothetical protein
MHFNNKRIGLGDSEKEIKNKINYNFNQILSFGIGHEGLIGPKGATGIPGPSGKIGPTGPTGNRSSEWFRSLTTPATGDSQEFDIWIDDSSPLGNIYERQSSSWSSTGLSLFNSNYFDVYSGIVGPLGLTDKSAIGFKSTYTPDQTSLVISDIVSTSSDVNPNNSKLLISTEDQVDSPIFSFVKSNSNSSDSPSFYWKNTGSLSDLIFKSVGGLFLNSELDMEISAYSPGAGWNFTINSNSFNSTTSGDTNLIGNSYIRPQTEENFILNSVNIGIDSNIFYTKTLTEISYGSGAYSYILSSIPTSGSTFNYFGGISINSRTSQYRVFDFTGVDGHSVLYGLPSGSVSSGNHKQTVFGETGGNPAGSTGGPYSYHVKRLNNLSLPPYGGFVIPYSRRNNQTISIMNPGDIVGVTNAIDISNPQYWNSNMLVITPNSIISDDAYVYIPGSPDPTLEPVFYTGEGNEYRVYLNDMYNPTPKKIKGIIYPYTFKNSSGNLLTRSIYINLPSSCSYIDLFWAYKGSNTNPNGRIFWKTCSGSSGFLELTNSYQITGNDAPDFFATA